jgi:hypothetical protein
MPLSAHGGHRWAGDDFAKADKRHGSELAGLGDSGLALALTDCLETRGHREIDYVDASRRPYILRRTGISKQSVTDCLERRIAT